MGALLINLGGCYIEIKEYKKAEKTLLEGLDIWEKIGGKDSPYYQMCANQLGLLYATMENYDKAIPLLMAAMENYKVNFGETHLYYLDAVRSVGQSFHKSGNFEEAKLHLLEAFEGYRQNYSPDHHNCYETASILASNSLKLGNEEKAIEYARLFETGIYQNFKRASSYLSEEEWLDFFSYNEDYLNDFYALASNYPQLPELTDMCFNNTLFQKGYLLSTNKRFKSRAKNNQATSDVFKDYQVKYKELANQLTLPLAHQNNAEALQNYVDSLEKELVLILGENPEEYSSISWKSVQAKISNHTAILEFVTYPHPCNCEEKEGIKVTSALILRKEDSNPQLIPLFEDDQFSNLQATRTLYSYQSNNDKNLSNLVYQKLAAHLQNIKTIYYSPSGVLHRINFGAIPINEAETIADRYDLHNLGSTRQLVYPHQSPNYSVTDAIVYGGIDYEKDTTTTIFVENIDSNENANLASRALQKDYRGLRGNNWDYLEWTAKEANEIAETLRKNKAEVFVYTGKEATEESFKNIGKERPSPRILHLATHGYFFPDPKEDAKTGFRTAEHPLIRSGLILAGGNHAWKGNAPIPGKEDGVLTAYEISQMDLSNTELVVLSACETGLGDIEGNEGVYGLQRAFKLAGAKYVLMSLWSVNDQKTYEFMTRFYELTQKEDKSIPAAYQQTQNEMRQKFAVPFNPRNWAGFVLVE